MNSNNDGVASGDMVNDVNNCSQSVIDPNTELNGNGDDDFDDFADFQEASPLVNENETINTPNCSGGQSGLPNVPVISTCKPKNTADNLPYFPSPTNSSTVNEIASNQFTTKSLPSLDNIVNQSFTKSIESDEQSMETEQSITMNLFNDKTSQSYKIWENLLNPEESTSFRFNWKSSHSFQVFLRSLKIDSKNVDNFFFNAFESSSESDELTMNSPVSATSQLPSEKEIVSKVSNVGISSSASSSSQNSSSSSLSSITTLPTTKSTSIVSNSTELIQQVPQVSSQNIEEPSVTISTKTENINSSASILEPPSSINKPNSELSELTNQTEEIQPSTINNQLSNNLLDVTFFLNNPNFMQPCSSPKASVKVNESEQSIQNNESSARPLSIISSSSTDPFHNLISHIQDVSSMRTSTKSSSQSKSTISPSESTNRIFEELPLLSFMRTKLLMFPMRDSIKD